MVPVVVVDEDMEARHWAASVAGSAQDRVLMLLLVREGGSGYWRGPMSRAMIRESCGTAAGQTESDTDYQ